MNLLHDTIKLSFQSSRQGQPHLSVNLAGRVDI